MKSSAPEATQRSKLSPPALSQVSTIHSVSVSTLFTVVLISTLWAADKFTIVVCFISEYGKDLEECIRSDKRSHFKQFLLPICQVGTNVSYTARWAPAKNTFYFLDHLSWPSLFWFRTGRCFSYPIFSILCHVFRQLAFLCVFLYVVSPFLFRSTSAPSPRSRNIWA